MRSHFIVHESFEAPGAYSSWAHSRGHAASYSNVYQGEPLPESADGIDFLIIMGGPQSPATTKAECPHFAAAAKIIAYSEGCPRQIVEYGKLVYGFQCHMEFDREVIELLIANTDPALETLAHYRFVQQAEALRKNNYSDMNAKLFMFLDKLSEEYKAAHP